MISVFIIFICMHLSNVHAYSFNIIVLNFDWNYDSGQNNIEIVYNFNILLSLWGGKLTQLGCEITEKQIAKPFCEICSF